MTAKTKTPRGKLRIGDDWNAISIIALAQSNPLKAVAEFVENSIDAGARHVIIVRGKEKGEPYLQITDDGEGIRKDVDGVPDFRHVATHICDSFKRRLKDDGIAGIQGEFGIGLLSFWTLGETLYMTSAGEDGRNYQMRMDRQNPDYAVSRTRSLAPVEGTDLKVKPLLPGIRQFSGEKLEWYLASELRDRIRTTGVDIRVLDRQARKNYRITPREFDGDLVHELPSLPTANGDVYLELYLTDAGDGQVGLYRSGTRVLAQLGELDDFANSVWTGGHLEGIVDVPFINLTPGTRSGIIRDGQYRTFADAIVPVTRHLETLVEARRRAEEERASEKMLKSIQRAFREALLALPIEDYDWFDIRRTSAGPPGTGSMADGTTAAGDDEVEEGLPLPTEPSDAPPQRDFFDFPGPLHGVRIAPTSSVLPVGQSRTLRAVCRDRSRRTVSQDLTFSWSLIEGDARLEGDDDEIVTITAAGEPGLAKVRVVVTQGGLVCEAEAAVTITDQLIDTRGRRSGSGHGLPGYTFEHAPGALWRSRYDAERNLIVINNGHRDFVYATRTNALKLRYIGRLYAKELVQKNFPGAPTAEVLERMIELTLYMEENLR
jgi:hypothetical protein